MGVLNFSDFSSFVNEAYIYGEDGGKTKKRRSAMSMIQCGYLEAININGVVDVVAKMDTGNGSFCSIHADEVEVKGDMVEWKFNGSTFTTPYTGTCRIRNRGDEERVKTTLNITFNGKTYSNVPFTIAHRNSSYAEVLLNRIFINTINAVVNPSRTFIATTRPANFTKKKKLKSGE